LAAFEREGSSAFAPVNDDHAVHSVEFAVTLNRTVDERDVRAAVLAHRHVSEDVPALATPASGETGIEMSYRRPNGTYTWAITLSGDTIHVECTRYTRWEKVWELSGRLMAFMMGACLQTDPGTVFSWATLTVTDKFVPRPSDASLETLLQTSDLLPRSLFQRGVAWHCNQGWFEEVDEESTILHQLNLSRKGELYFAPKALAPVSRFVVIVEHVQQFRSGDHPAVSKEALGWLDAEMNTMHAKNKEVLATLISPAMQEAIRLWS
jgi:uncharacterized protein (TIGR04255 family)